LAACPRWRLAQASIRWADSHSTLIPQNSIAALLLAGGVFDRCVAPEARRHTRAPDRVPLRRARARPYAPNRRRTPDCARWSPAVAASQTSRAKTTSPHPRTAARTSLPRPRPAPQNLYQRRL
jgi:hypothetical protein